MTDVDQLAALSRDFRAHFQENVEAHAKMHAELQAVVAELQRHCAEETRVRKAIFGNGVAGHDERIRTIERFVEVHRRLTWIIVTAIVLGALSIAWSAVVFFLQQNQVQ